MIIIEKLSQLILINEPGCKAFIVLVSGKRGINLKYAHLEVQPGFK